MPTLEDVYCKFGQVAQGAQLLETLLVNFAHRAPLCGGGTVGC